MKRFSDLQFVEFLDGVSARVVYGDYELSVVKHSGSYGGRNGMYEIAVFKGHEMLEMPGITQDGDTVKGWLSEQDVTSIMKKMIAVGGPK